MLPRSRRLTRKLFDQVRMSRLVVGTQAASFRFVPSCSSGRFSVVVPKAVAKNAVRRNKLRRLIYEVLRTQKTNLDGIFYAREAVLNAGPVTKTVHELLRLAEKHPPKPPPDLVAVFGTEPAVGGLGRRQNSLRG